jgi:hypothetical protein
VLLDDGVAHARGTREAGVRIVRFGRRRRRECSPATTKEGINLGILWIILIVILILALLGFFTRGRW